MTNEVELSIHLSKWFEKEGWELRWEGGEGDVECGFDGER